MAAIKPTEIEMPFKKTPVKHTKIVQTVASFEGVADKAL